MAFRRPPMNLLAGRDCCGTQARGGFRDCVSENVENVEPIAGRHVGISPRVVLPRENLVQALPKVVLHFLRQGSKRGGVNEKAARIAEQAGFEIKLKKGTSFRIERTGTLKLFSKAGGAGHTAFERRLVPEKQILEQRFAGEGDPLPG